MVDLAVFNIKWMQGRGSTAGKQRITFDSQLAVFVRRSVSELLKYNWL